MPSLRQIHRGLYREMKEERNSYFNKALKKYYIGQEINHDGEKYTLVNFWPDLKRKDFPIEFQEAVIMGRIQNDEENSFVIELESYHKSTGTNN